MREATATEFGRIRGMDDPGLGVAAEVGASALQLTGANAVAVYIFDEAKHGYTGAASLTTDQTLALPLGLSPDDVDATVTQSSPVATFSLARELEGPIAEQARRMNAASLLVIRCDRGPRALGLMLCTFDELRTFDAGDERDAAALARVVSTTLDYSRRTNAALDRADRLATLLDTASAFAGELDLESLFAAIHDQVYRHMDSPSFYVSLESSEAGALRTEYAVDAGLRIQAEARVPSPMTRRVFESSRPIVLEADRDAASMETEWSGGERPASALYVPMRLRDRVIGVMSVLSSKPDAYGAVEVEVLLELAEQAATAIQNAGMFREERRRMRELSVLHRLAALTNSEAHLDRIMNAIVTEAASAFRADAASIALENERGDFTLAATLGVSDAYKHTRIIPGASLRALYGSPPTERFIGPDENEKMGQTDLVSAEGITNWFLVPLLQQGRLIGSLALCGRERLIRLSPSETGLARLFAEQAAAAMLRAQSAHALTERIEDYDLLTRVGRALVSRLEVDYDAILRLLRDQLGYTHLAILTFEGDPPSLALKAHLGHGEHAGAMALEPDRGVIGAVAIAGEMLYLPDVSKDPRYVQTTVDVQSQIAYPLKYGGQVLGVLDVQSESRDAFTARDRRILAALADQCAIALSNARQYATAGSRLQSLGAARAQLEQYAEYLERRQEDLKLVNSVSAAASATLNLDRILESAVRSVADGLRVDRCSVGILDDDLSRIEIAAEHRPDGRPTNVGVRLPLGQSSVLARSVTQRRTIATEDALADPRFADVRKEMTAMSVRGTVIVPLVAGGRVIGTLSVNSSGGPRRFSEEEIEVLETVANQLALGVRNARLYGRARDRANEDSLTGIFNHRYLHERLEHELLRARRAGHPLAIALFDLNNFKMFNDTFGHQAGDEVLRVVAATLGMCLRATDIGGRYGGDEFLVILPQADEPGAQMLLERVRRRLAEQSKAGFPPVPVELAAGIAVFPRDGQSKRDLISRADQAMYAHKRVDGLPTAGA